MKNLALQTAVSARTQVVEHFRALIRSGALPPKAKLPTQMALARELHVSDTTIHFAFQDLIREGLVESGRGRGTFVADALPGLSRVGLYYPKDVLSNPETHYLRAVHATLTAACAGGAISIRQFHDPRPELEEGEVWSELLAAVTTRQVQAVIAPCVDIRLLGWLGKLDIPVATGASHRAVHGVAFDLANFIDLALAEVQTAGCRTVGLISPLPTRFRDVVDFGDHDFAAFTRRFIDRAGSCGLDVRNAWIREPRDEHDPVRHHEAYGYEQARALLRQPQLPAGLVVYSDAVARGVITALLAEGERAAGMTMVLHKTAEIPLLCPLPAHFVVSSAGAIARELLAMVARQFRGEPPGGPIRLPFHVETPVVNSQLRR